MQPEKETENNNKKRNPLFFENNSTGNDYSDNAKQSTPDVPAINTPKGGGAISSIGEKFQANPVTGTGSFSVPITISPGRNGFTPQLAFSYDSGSGNSEFGMGWSIGLPSITRKTQKGLPQYQEEEESDIFLLAGSEDLIPKLADNNGAWSHAEQEVNGFYIKQYRPRIEGIHAKIEKHTEISTGAIHWEVTTKDNITSVYGKSADARVFDPKDHAKVFQWMLEYTYDEKGNITLYEYKKENSENIDTGHIHEKNRIANQSAFNKTYLKSVKYTPDTPFNPSNSSYFDTANWHFQLLLDYGEHDASNPTVAETNTWPVRQDPFSSFRSGFEIRTYRLCRRVLLFHQFENDLGAEPYLVKSTDQAFDENPVATRVTSIQHRCYQSGEAAANYPPVTFTYSKASVDANVYQHEIQDLENLPVGVDGAQYRWTDLNGDGLQGVLLEDQNAWYFKRNLGNAHYYEDLPANETPAPQATFGTMTQVLEQPTLANGQITDIDGNGTPDLVVYNPVQPGYYEKNKEDGWERFRPFETAPDIDWNDPNLRRIDIDGDGFADLIMTQENCFLCYPSRAEKGFGPSYETLKAFDEEQGPRIIFSDLDQSIYLADMSGDSLTDIVRIENGAVCYWPNLGYGHFGAKVGLDNAPYFDHPDLFSQQRIRLADVDGSGTTDIIYIADEGVKYYPNHSGNALGDEVFINQRLPTHNLSQITTIDLLGSGTQCIVWSSPVLGDHPPALKYVDLMGAVKPYLLTQMNNNMGSITRLKYAPSTKFYLRDERNGNPWVTKLPFPVQVLERVELWDEVNRNRFVSKYAYHHGYFDGVEREFRGFGMVEQWDTESFSDFTDEGLFPPGYNASEEVLHVPPVYTKTWFHTGFLDRHTAQNEDPSNIWTQYESEYWSGDADAFDLTGHSSGSLSTFQYDIELLREAARALKGSPLRQEIYSQDGSPEEENPYVVTENAYEIKLIQPITLRGAHGGIDFASGARRRDRDYASLQVIPTETLSYQYERNPTDPRISHQLTLETDEFGQVVKSANVVYSRRTSTGHAEQDHIKIIVQENALINEPDHATFYRLGVPAETKSYELTGVSTPTTLEGWRTNILSDFNSATEIAFDTAPVTGLEKRLLDRTYILYYDEALSAPLAFGTTASHALPYETYQMALTGGLIPNLLNDDGVARVDAPLLTEGGYVDLLSDGSQWIPSGRMQFDSAQFYLPTAQTDPFGNQTLFDYGTYHFLLTTVTDAIGNINQAQYDHRVLKPNLVTDPNGNRQAFDFDVRGMVTKLAVMGKEGAADGDTLTDPTSEFSYELFSWLDDQQPNWAFTKTRETHGDPGTRYMESYAYSNGLGQVVMTKSKVAPGDAYLREADGSLSRGENDELVVGTATPRWAGSGRTILDNKGNPIKQYEPYFSSTHDYETEAELVEYGVTPIIHYDPLGRAIRTELPDDTLTRVVFSPWHQENYDQNDTVLESLWYVERGSPDPNGQQPTTNSEERAAWLAAQHANTPQIIHLDNLGRPFITIDDNGADGLYAITTELDIKDNPLRITDAKGRQAFTYRYDMLGQPLKTTHLDNGERRALNNVVGNPLRTWDSRDQQFRFAYDELQRPVKTHVTTNFDQADPVEALVSLTVYGESEINPEASNLRGQPYLVFDSAGLIKNTAFDFKGNLLSTARQLAITYQTSPDWSALDGETTVSGMLTAAAPLLETNAYVQSSLFDALNRPVSMTQPDNSEVLPTYDDGGRLSAMESKLRGATTSTAFVTQIDYNARGQRNHITYGNGAHTTYHYDARTFQLTRLITTRNTGADILQDLNYVYDPVGNIVEMTDNAQETIFFNNAQVAPNAQYEYDALYRLLHATGRQMEGLGAPSNTDVNIQSLPDATTTALELYTQSYQYDELGNILHMTQAANSSSWNRYYHYAANNYLLSTSGDNIQPTTDAYTYDAHGNMEVMPHLAAMTWDYADRLQSADLSGGGMAYYTYDAGGNRVRKVIENGNITEERIYLGDWEVYRRTINGTLDTERETLHLTDDMGRIALVDTETVGSINENIRYQMSNHLGSATLDLDDAAAVISYEEYHPFGTTSYRSDSSTSEVSLKRYRYVGKERDDETGLYYYGARYYAAWLGRFVSTDPLKDKYIQLSPYQYAGNDPIGDIDVDGLEGTKTKEPPKTFQGFPIISQTSEPILDGPEESPTGFSTRETRFKIKPGLGGLVKQLINSRGELVKNIDSGIFGIGRQTNENDSFDFEQIFRSDQPLKDVTVLGSAPDVKEVFAPISSNSTNNFVHKTEGGLLISRLSTNDRKRLGVGLELVSLNKVAGLAKIFAEIYAGTADDGTGRDALSVPGIFVKDLAKASEIFGSSLNIINVIDIATSDPTKEEIITGLIFDFISKGLDPELNGKLVNRRENLLFIEGASDVNSIKGRLNSVFNLFDQFIEQNSNIDITKEGGKAEAFKSVIQGLRDLGENARLHQN